MSTCTVAAELPRAGAEVARLAAISAGNLGDGWGV